MPRTRSSTTDIPQSCVVSYASEATGPWTPATLSLGPGTGTSRLMTDEVTPAFKKRVNNGEIVMNNLTSYSSDIQRSGSYSLAFESRNNVTGALEGSRLYLRLDSGDYTDHRGRRYSIPDMDSTSRNAELAAYGPPGWSMIHVEQVLLARALEKASSPDTLALVTAAELNKTVALVTSAARFANKAAGLLESLGPSRVRALNVWLLELQKELRGKNKGAIIRSMLRRLDGAVRVAAGTWLGYRYGILATVYDIESWVEASAANPRRVRTVVKQQTSWESEPDIYTESRGPAPDWRWGPATRVVRRQRTTISSAGVLVRAGLFDDDALAGMNRFGVNRFASSLWELTPYSFVFDWLIDIGTRIAAFEGSLQVSPLGSWISHEHTLNYSWEWISGPSTIVDATHTHTVTGSNSAQTVERCVYRVRKANPTLSPIPQVTVRLNWKRLADAVGLLTVASTGFRKELYRSIRI